MFYPECEHLAREMPALERQISKIDILIYRIGENGIIRPEDSARVLNEPVSQVSGVVKALHERGLLDEAVYFECWSCGNLVDPKDFDQALADYGQYECSQCLTRLDETLRNKRVVVYTLKHSKVLPIQKFKDLPRPLKVFYSYAHEDEELRKQLERHLSPLRREGLIRDWHDRKLLAGSDLGTEIDAHLREAHIVLLLISSDFFASDYCYSIEMQYALAKHSTDELKVIPVILRECDWSHAPFAKLVALPTDGRAVTSKAWNSPDEAFTVVARGIRELLDN